MNRYFLLATSMVFMLAVSSSAQAPLTSHPPENNSGSTAKEDWTVLSLGQGGINTHDNSGIVFGKSEQPGFTSESIRVEWRSGDPIDLYVVRPVGVAKPPVILYLYDYVSDTDRFRNEAWCQRVTEHGFAAVGFVSALTGHRYHGRPMREWFVSELQEALGSSAHDVQMIINYLATRDDLDTTRLGMFGENSGATIAILAAAADPRIKFVDAINPWGDWPHWLLASHVVPEQERDTYLKPEFLRKVTTLDPVAYLPAFAPDRIRIEQVANDPMTPANVQARIEAAAPASSVIAHYPDVQALVRVWGTGNWWLKEKLQPSGASMTAAALHPVAP